MSAIKVSDISKAIRWPIGYVGENGFRAVSVDVSSWLAEYPDGAIGAVFKRPDGETYPVAVTTNAGILTWIPAETDLSAPGTGALEIRIISGETVGKSAQLSTYTAESLTGGNTPQPPEPDWLNTVIAAAATAIAEAVKAKDYAAAAELSRSAAVLAQTAAEAAKDAAESSQAAAELSADNAKGSETNAGQSATTAAQALADLLAMLGNDIATLVGGKIPLSQIPATATQEIYTITSESELTGLTAQRGDLAELIETLNGEATITKTWQCLGDSTVRANWVVWGTSYAVQAGSATLAENAENSDKINGHRLPEMTYEQFVAAVKDPGTYYLVYPEATA